MFDSYEKAAKALNLDLDKIWSDMARVLVREEAYKSGTKEDEEGNEMK